MYDAIETRLALMAGIATGAEWVFLPERPPPLEFGKYGDDWMTEMCETGMGRILIWVDVSTVASVL